MADYKYKFAIGTRVRYHHNLKPDHVDEMAPLDGREGIISGRQPSLHNHPHYLVRFKEQVGLRTSGWWCREDSIEQVHTVKVTTTRKEVQS